MSIKESCKRRKCLGLGIKEGSKRRKCLELSIKVGSKRRKCLELSIGGVSNQSAGVAPRGHGGTALFFPSTHICEG